MNRIKMRKPFSKALYDKADPKAKGVLRTYLLNQGHKLEKDTENYYCDIEGEDGHGWEVEIKYSWPLYWPPTWLDVRIPYRKKRLIDKKGEDNITFYILNGMCNQAWEIPGVIVSRAEVKEVSNRFMPEGEMFYNILISQAKKIYLDKGK
jgi:hypothetical protein|tara:strand:+ start:3110 stop:3559 length:450 start_codon:yes stop_codon:yes gene_type:complete